MVHWQKGHLAHKNLCYLSPKILIWNKCRKKTEGKSTKWVSEQGFMSHSTQNRSFWRRSSSQSFGLVWKKLNLTQQKHSFTNQKKSTTTQHKINTKKLKPGLVAFYNIWPGNGEGLFLFWHFINLSLTYFTYLDTYLLSYSPRTHMGHESTNYCSIWQRQCQTRKNYSLTCFSGSNSSIFRTSILFTQTIIGLFVNNGLMLLNNSIWQKKTHKTVATSWEIVTYQLISNTPNTKKDQN